LIGIVAWFYLPPSPTQTASKFRGKDGWFNEREEKISASPVSLRVYTTEVLTCKSGKSNHPR